MIGAADVATVTALAGLVSGAITLGNEWLKNREAARKGRSETAVAEKRLDQEVADNIFRRSKELIDIYEAQAVKLQKRIDELESRMSQLEAENDTYRRILTQHGWLPD